MALSPIPDGIKCKSYYSLMASRRAIKEADAITSKLEISSFAAKPLLSDGSSEGILPWNQKDFFKNFASDFMINCLETLMSTILAPFAIWRTISKNEHIVKIIRVILEVILELIMWLLFAGVSILTAIILIIDDFYVKDNNNNDDNDVPK